MTSRRSPGPRRRATHRGHFRSRGAGWEYVHVCVDDCTRIAYVELLSDERPQTSVGFLRRALGFFCAHGVTVERLMTDNGNPYRSRLHAEACRELGIRHLRTEAYRPRTNGKAERLIRTLLAGWAYRHAYRSSAERAAALAPFLNFYNHRRPHRGIGGRAPATKLSELMNLASAYS